MSLFFETLLLKDGSIRNLSYHNDRLNRTITDNFKTKSSIDLSDYIDLDKENSRVKVIYSKKIDSIKYFKIKERNFKSFKLIESDLEYRYKYLDRSKIDLLFSNRGNCDDIIITSNGYIKDSSIANIAIFNGKDWISPKTPLLNGTMRGYLLKNKLLLEKDVKIEELKVAKKIALMNAVIGFYEIEDFIIKD